MAAVLTLPSTLTDRGVTLRGITALDAPFLRALFATARSDAELIALLPASQREPFLDDQFRLQDVHYRRYFSGADFLVIERLGKPIGRLILDRSQPVWEVIDIALIPALRGQGIGGALMHAIVDGAYGARAACVRLHVDTERNRLFYERLGFVVTGEEGMHLEMRWAPPLS